MCFRARMDAAVNTVKPQFFCLAEPIMAYVTQAAVFSDARKEFRFVNIVSSHIIYYM